MLVASGPGQEAVEPFCDRSLEATDRALIAVGRKDAAAEASLVHPDVRLPNAVTPLDRIVDHGRDLLDEWPAHHAWLHKDLQRRSVVSDGR